MKGIMEMVVGYGDEVTADIVIAINARYLLEFQIAVAIIISFVVSHKT